MENQLDVLAVIGFKGATIDGLILHPDNEHIIFPLGNQIVVRNILTREQKYLRGHDNDISVICVSNNGKYLATGQKTHSGFKADIIIWDFETGTLIHRLGIHKVAIQALSFSYNDNYLVSLGGVEDNYLIVWDVQSGKALCGNVAGTDQVNSVKFFNNRDDQIITCQNYGVKIWKIDYTAKKLISTDVNFGNLRRIFTCICIDTSDKYAFLGTKTGDIIEVDVTNAIYKRIGPVKRLFSQGIITIVALPNNDLIVGTGEGVIAKIGYFELKIKCESKLLGAVTSITLTADSSYFFCGTSQSNIYWGECSTLICEIRSTCHYDKINDIAFPSNYSEVFGTCSRNDIRVWNSKTRQELLRIHIPNLECYCLGFMRDGKSIFSGWHDGKIRSFLPQSGKLLYAINDAHVNGVTAIAATNCGSKLVSGGMNGEIRIWKIGKQSQTLESSLKEHRGRVWSIIINSLNDRAVSASADGSCIIWDIKNYTRIACMFESTMFKQLVFYPDDSQIVTCGSDKKLTYWDTIDAEEIRMMDGSLEGEINSVSITKEGETFISAGEDRLIKVWNYEKGICNYIGIGHSTTITRCIIAPNQEFIVSVGTDGSIFFWDMPIELRCAKKDLNQPKDYEY